MIKATPLHRPEHLRPSRTATVALLCAALASTYSFTAWSATTQVDNEPLATRPAVKAKPNLMVILDTSGSMERAYMPDSMTENSGSTSCTGSGWNQVCTPIPRYGYRSAQCNGVAFDPGMTYVPPKKYDGTSYPDATYPSAKDDGYSTASSPSTSNLSSHYYFTYSGTQPKMGWVYTVAGGDTPVDNTFRKECYSAEGANPGAQVFTKVNVSSLDTAAKKTNYANWYSYYSKRYLLMRTAMGRAMAGLDSGYRVGFSSIHETGYTDGGTLKFLGVNDFTGGSNGQKDKFYASLYGVAPNNATPLRRALANTGRYFANKISGQVDPIQYSCQRNFALLTTDGYWNGENGKQLNGTTNIGQQDGLEARPMRDDSIVQDQTVTVYTAPATRDRIDTIAMRRTVTQSSTKTASNKLYTRTRTCYESGTETTTTAQSGTATYTKTTIGSGTPTNSAITYANWSNTDIPNTSTSASGNYSSCGSTYTYSPSNPGGTSGWSSASYSNPGSWVSTGGGTNTSYTNTTPTLHSSSSFVAGTSTTTQVVTGGGTSDTLADVAQYYWQNDLRSSALNNCQSSASGLERNVCGNIVPTSSTDPASHQHMNTFGIGLGVSGTLTYDKDYLTQTSGTYVDLKSGAINWPAPEFSEQSGGGYSGSTGGPANIDDLWHAAVNGRGRYYSALSASALNDAIAGVIGALDPVDGAAASAATSSLELVAGNDNRLYRASYTTAAWTGDLTAYALAGETATVSATVSWSAQALLNAKLYTSRNIYFNNSGALAAFDPTNVTGTLQANFSNMCSKTVVSGQCATLNTADLAKANSATNLINYLRGDRTHESTTLDGTTEVAALYRKRAHVLGDIVNGAPVYVGQPPFSYADEGYATFKATARTPMIYTAANDGMLHAFNASTGSSGGNEVWAFIPTAVMPNLYKLADSNYAVKHQYFVDGAPIMGDIKVGTVWKTILVGGLNKGGKSYYALDITNPSSPQLLWEFSHANLGLTFGNPVITKNAAGTWIVAFGSGYNNETGDGKGRLFILNANTGAQIVNGGIPTTAGDTTTPSGLAKINAWVENASDNTATRFYGGDLLGNIWRFDYDGLVEPTNAALKLGVAQTATAAQSITTKPMLLQAGGKPVVIVGTGRYLGEGDITDTSQQSIYAIKDPLTNNGWGDIRTNTSFIKQTLTLNTGAKTASVTNNTVDWTSQAGWWVDLPNPKERVSTPMTLQLTTLVVPTTIPSGDACMSGGSSWLYFLNAASGGTINTNPVGAEQSDSSLLVGTNWVRDSDGNIRLIVQDSQGNITTKTPPVAGSGGMGTAHRTSWRELVD